MAEKTPPPKKDRDSGGKPPNRRNPFKNDDKFEWTKATRTLTFWILIVIVSWILFRQFNLTEQPSVEKSYSQYRKLLESGQIDAAEVIEREFHGQLKDGTSIVTTMPFVDQQMLAEWDSLKIDYQFKEKTTSWIGYLITSILPWVIIIGIWLYIMRRMQGGGSRGVFSFGKSRAKLMVQSKQKVTFNDVAGCDEAKEELKEVIDFLKDPKKFSKLGGRIPKGALLLGPPGTGKTLLARAIAGEAEVPFFSMSGADFVEMFVGVGAARVRDLFEQGKKNAPCILFIDEIDAVGRQRGAGLGGGHDEREQTLNQLLVEMDGFESNEGVILIAATNRPDVLDPALTRPGRFDRQIVVDRPDVRGREGIFKVHTREIPLDGDVKLDVLAKSTPGLAGAELANIVNEAALLAARRNGTKVTMIDFEEAKDKVMMGAERRSLLISEDEKKQTAYHEAGHVLVAKMSPGSDRVHKVTIIPRGRALGVTHYLPIDEKHNYSKTFLNQNLVHLLGGRAAEKIIFNEQSTGAGNDIEQATQIARKMVCEWGMSDKLGPIALGSKNSEIFLGRDFAQQRNFSEETAQDIDAEIRKIVLRAEQRAEKILRENPKKLHVLAQTLLEREILDGEEIDIVLKGGRLQPLVEKTPEPLKPPQERKQGTASTQRRVRPVQKPPVQKPPVQKPSVQKPPVQKPPVQKPPVQTKQAESKEDRAPISASKSRWNLARSYGVASSRDPGNRRPTSRELAQMDQDREKAAAEKSAGTPPAKADGTDSSARETKPAADPTTADQPRTQPRRRPRTRRTYSRTSSRPQTGTKPALQEKPSSPESKGSPHAGTKDKPGDKGTVE